MSNLKTLFFVCLIAFAAWFAWFWVQTLRRRGQMQRPSWYELLVGAVTDFFDCFGIGSFATTTTLYRLRRTVSDEKIPGTLNVGHCLPTFMQALVFSEKVAVEPVTLVLLVGSSVLGAYLGAGVVSRLPRRQVQIGMGAALLVAAALLIVKIYDPVPHDGTAIGLAGAKLVAAIAATFVFGALMTIGIGAYAPIMITVAFLGMEPTTAWPIMMGSCALLMPVAGAKFIRTEAYDVRAALGLTLAGTPAVLVAGWVFDQIRGRLPLKAIFALVAVVVVYAGVTMLIAARKEGRPATTGPN